MLCGLPQMEASPLEYSSRPSREFQINANHPIFYKLTPFRVSFSQANPGPSDFLTRKKMLVAATKMVLRFCKKYYFGRKSSLDKKWTIMAKKFKGIAKSQTSRRNLSQETSISMFWTLATSCFCELFFVLHFRVAQPFIRPSWKCREGTIPMIFLCGSITNNTSTLLILPNLKCDILLVKYLWF